MYVYLFTVFHLYDIYIYIYNIYIYIPRPSVWVSNFSLKRAPVFGVFFGAQIAHPNGGFIELQASIPPRRC